MDGKRAGENTAAWHDAVRFLSARDRSEHELRAFLRSTGVETAALEAVVERLRALAYLDDGRVARGAAEAAVRRGHGSLRLRAELAARGVGAGTIDAAVEAAFGDETAQARALLARRFPGLSGAPAERARAARFLSRRGFAEEIVLAILGEGC